MGELWFVGAGLGDERDLSERAVETLRSCDALFAEEYTSLLAAGSLERLAQQLGKPIVLLTRSEVEAGDRLLASLAGNARVGLVTAGDPFVATTHVALRISVEHAGHRWQYIPGPSILTAAVSLLGLMHYRFGRTVSLPFVDPGFDPVSPFEAIGRNRTAGLHTLLLLDLRPSEHRFLTAPEALARLAGDRAAVAGLADDSELGVVARVGRSDARAWWGTRRALGTAEFGPPLHAVVVPAAELHFEESEAVARWRVAFAT